MRIGNGFNILNFLHGKGLSANKIGGGLHSYKGNMIYTIGGNNIPQFLQIHVPLKWIGTFNFEGFVGIYFQNCSSIDLHVSLGGGEVIVHGNHVPLIDKYLRDYILCSTALVHRKHIMLAKYFPQGLFHPVETLGPRISIICLQHGSHLVITHGIRTAIGEHIKKYVLSIQKKGIEAPFPDGLEPFIDGLQMKLLYNPDFMKFNGHFWSTVEFNLLHAYIGFRFKNES